MLFEFYVPIIALAIKNKCPIKDVIKDPHFVCVLSPNTYLQYLCKHSVLPIVTKPAKSCLPTSATGTCTQKIPFIYYSRELFTSDTAIVEDMYPEEILSQTSTCGIKLFKLKFIEPSKPVNFLFLLYIDWRYSLSNCKFYNESFPSDLRHERNIIN